jgi:hypothetical protein
VTVPWSMSNGCLGVRPPLSLIYPSWDVVSPHPASQGFGRTPVSRSGLESVPSGADETPRDLLGHSAPLLEAVSLLWGVKALNFSSLRGTSK